MAAVRREHARLWSLSPASSPPTGDWLAAGARVLTGEAGAVRLGTWVRWHLRVEEGHVVEARWQAYGCPAVLAAAQHLAARLPGLARGDALPGTPAQWLEVVNSPVEKLGRMLIIEDAARAAFASWPD
jgi:NifU-like protein involved in Fe-S cluster formation